MAPGSLLLMQGDLRIEDLSPVDSIPRDSYTVLGMGKFRNYGIEDECFVRVRDLDTGKVILRHDIKPRSIDEFELTLENTHNPSPSDGDIWNLRLESGHYYGWPPMATAMVDDIQDFTIALNDDPPIPQHMPPSSGFAVIGSLVFIAVLVGLLYKKPKFVRQWLK